MMKAVKIFLSSFLLFLCAYLIYLNCKLYYRPAFSKANGSEVNPDLQKQLQFLKNKMHKGEDRNMQMLFPEGYIFMNSLYGLSQAEMAKGKTGALYQEAYLESYRCYMKMEGEEGRSFFSDDLLLPYGAYYNGWSAFHMAKLISSEPATKHDSLLSATFKKRCADIALALSRQQNPYLESYHNMAWPADVLTCVAALAEHDKLFEPVYQETIRNWVKEAKLRLDTLGMLPHQVSAIDGKPVQNARGSSMSLMLCFLKEVDPSFYRQQLILYRKYFLTSRFGLPGIREYPEGSDGGGDSDSGPVILGVGGSASIVGLRVFALERDAPVALGLRNSIEAFGMAMQGGEGKKYIFGKLPMADAFIAWANSTEQTQADELSTGEPWRRNFQIYSGLVLAGLGFSLLLIWRKPKVNG